MEFWIIGECRQPCADRNYGVEPKFALIKSAYSTRRGFSPSHYLYDIDSFCMKRFLVDKLGEWVLINTRWDYSILFCCLFLGTWESKYVSERGSLKDLRYHITNEWQQLTPKPQQSQRFLFYSLKSLNGRSETNHKIRLNVIFNNFCKLRLQFINYQWYYFYHLEYNKIIVKWNYWLENIKPKKWTLTYFSWFVVYFPDNIVHVTATPSLLGLSSYLNNHSASSIAKPVASRPPPHFNPHLLLAAHCRPQPYMTGELCFNSSLSLLLGI